MARMNLAKVARRAAGSQGMFFQRRGVAAQATMMNQQSFFKPMSNPKQYIDSLHDKEDLLENIVFPEIYPIPEAGFSRIDKRDDGKFYADPRIGVSHVDDSSLKSLVDIHAAHLPPAVDIHLDLCSSWQSHLPEDYKAGEIVGIGMSGPEMAENPRLTSHFVMDFNKGDYRLPFEDDTVDAATCALSIDYLTRPFELLQEVYRVLRPGGKVYITFSNRCFPTKVINVWLSANDLQRVALVSSYFHYGMQWAELTAKDCTPEGAKEPLFLVSAKKPE